MGRLRKNPELLEKKITFRIDEKRLDELERCAAFEGMPVSFIVRHLVIRFLEDRRRYPGSYTGMHGFRSEQ